MIKDGDGMILSGVSTIRKHGYVSCKHSHARRAWAFTAKGVAISHTTLSLNQGILLALYFYLLFHLLLFLLDCFDMLCLFGERFSVRAVFVLLACLGALFHFLNTDHVPFSGHALARKKEPTLGV